MIARQCMEIISFLIFFYLIPYFVWVKFRHLRGVFNVLISVLTFFASFYAITLKKMRTTEKYFWRVNFGKTLNAHKSLKWPCRLGLWPFLESDAFGCFCKRNHDFCENFASQENGYLCIFQFYYFFFVSFSAPWIHIRTKSFFILIENY